MKRLLSLSFGIAALLAGFLIFEPVYAVQLEELALITNLDQFIDQLPAPFAEFIRTADQISDNVTAKSYEIRTRLKVLDVIEELDNWLAGITGITFTQIFKGVINLIVWLLNMVTELFRWVLSLLS